MRDPGELAARRAAGRSRRRSMRGDAAPAFDLVIAVDWGKAIAKRRAWLGDLATRTLQPLEIAPPTVRGILQALATRPGRALVGIDAALGVPGPYLCGARTHVPGWSAAATFLDWLPLAMTATRLAEAARSPDEWTYTRPFIAVPKGLGALRAFRDRYRGHLMRAVDDATGAKSCFIVSGIPGTVGSGTRALWHELTELLPARAFAVWPFDGSLAALARSRVVLAEMYPRVCYALALSDSLPAALQRLAKTDVRERDRALQRLASAPWARALDIDIRHLERARANEDDFDAMISAAALMRAILEGRALDTGRECPVEGSMLGLPALRG